MRCDEVVLLLWEYLDEELGPEEAKVVGAHLRRCGRCHPFYCCDRAFLELLARQRARCVAPPFLTAALRAQLRLY
jgi:predicted anti-sigma-YlaC factor YlaD